MSYTAVITGGNKGIGADIAQALLEREYKVVSVARHDPELRHPNLYSYCTDLLDKDAVSEAAAQIASDHKVTHLIHNAGLIWPNLIEQAEPEEIAGLSQLHLGSALALAKAFLPSMKASQFGRILFNGSRAGLGAPTRTAYSATKAGMIGMARTWALELAPDGITVNVIAPGLIETRLSKALTGNPEIMSIFNQRTSIKRPGQPSEIAGMAAYLASADGSYTTGQVFAVDGGFTIS